MCCWNTWQYADFWLHECVTQAVAFVFLCTTEILASDRLYSVLFPEEWCSVAWRSYAGLSSLTSRYLCSHEAMLLCFTIPSELTYACDIFASVYPRLFHLPALEYLLAFLCWDLAVIFEGQRVIMDWSNTVFERDVPVSFSLQRQISQPADVFPKMEICKPFPKLDTSHKVDLK